MRHLAPGSRVGRFEIVGLLGEGAMGVVYLANDPEIERPVAIKTLRSAAPPGQPPGEIETRFIKEAKLAGRLQHPNIVTIYEVGRADEAFFIAMEYVEGEPLNRVADSGSAFPLSQRVAVIRQVAEALQHAHERGVLHRDVKPGNILVTRDRRVKVADFGIGKLLSGASADLTRTGQMLGSPAYMSPEQIRGERLDGRSDLFSLGVVCYELLTGARPFPGESITTLVYQILHTEPRDPLAVRADLPPASREVFTRLLAKPLDRRPANAAEFLRELGRIDEALDDVEPTRVLPIPGSARPARTQPVAPSTAAAAAAAGAPPAAPPSPAEAPAAGPPPKPARIPAISLFGAAALLLAAGALVWAWRTSGRATAVAPRGTTPAPATTRAAEGARAPAGEVLAPGAPPAPAAPPEPTLPATLPTAGPSGAADSIVGAARGPRPTAAVRARPTSVAVAVTDSAEPPAPAPTRVAETAPAHVPDGEPDRAPDNVYRTRRFAKFGVSPDQARLYVDGRYVGIADDWDDRGGGRLFEFTREGVHPVRLELPGYRTLRLDVLMTRSADDESVDIGDELTRETRSPYPKVPSLTDRTIGPVEFEVDPPEATVSEGGHTLGTASSLGSQSPLRLTGPAVHELLLAAPGRQPRTVRILVSSNSDRERARVKLELKRAE